MLPLLSKGQIISKGNFGVFNSSKIRTKIFFPSRLRQKFKVRFLEELKAPKFPFEIDWPLVVLKRGFDTLQRDFCLILNFLWLWHMITFSIHLCNPDAVLWEKHCQSKSTYWAVHHISTKNQFWGQKLTICLYILVND